MANFIEEKKTKRLLKSYSKSTETMVRARSKARTFDARVLNLPIAKTRLLHRNFAQQGLLLFVIKKI